MRKPAMRRIPNNVHDIWYLCSKMGFAPIRGFILWLLLKRGNKIPFLGKNVKVISGRKIIFGRFVWISHGCYIDADVQNLCIFGDGVTIREHSVVQCRSGFNEKGHSLKIGNNVFIGPFAKIGVGGRVDIGDNCQIGSHFSLNAESHVAKDADYVSGLVDRKGITIGKNVWIGDKVTILDGVDIGDNCVIGAGAVVRTSFPPNSKIVGVPARLVE